jgi:uncharacterized membrane protein YkoI
MSVRGLRVVVATLATLFMADLAHAELDLKQLKLVRVAPTGLRQAVSVAEHQLKGKAYAATSSFNGDAVLYTIKLLVGEKAVATTIDAKTGKVTGSNAVSGENAGLLKEFAKVKGTLIAAMRTAETTSKGKSFAAAFKRLGSKFIFDVEAAARDDAEKQVFIDPSTGKIRKVVDKSTLPAAATAQGATPFVP